ncbi:MAG: phenylalanine--tRNA ligase subunit beta [Candidatus Aenigmarchaeota archaeon]|nr:phenylalanine--tRNA ligase subunit beta [Candidatus Aenigmarchaeota archaeon]
MPVITVNKKDFCRLLGKELSMQEIQEKLPMIGVAWEDNTKEEFEIEVTPNRPDMLSVEGLARAFSSFINMRTGLKEYDAQRSEYLVRVDQSTERVRPFIVCAVVTGIRFTNDSIKSLMDLQEKLHVTHCRKRKKGAIGVHDLSQIKFPLTYTTKDPNFKFIPLEETKEFSLKEILEKTQKGKDYAWILEGKNKYPILMDSTGQVLSFPPIINSDKTKLNPQTENIFIDVTGTDEKTINEVLNIITTSLAERNGKLHLVKIKYPYKTIETPLLKKSVMNLDPKYVNKLLGTNLSNLEITVLLQRMGFNAYEESKENIKVIIPCYRTDIMHQIDLVEDVAIAYGYDKFKPEIPNISTIGEEKPIERFAKKIRELMVGFGFQEVLTFILTNKQNLFAKMNIKETKTAETLNPKTQEYCIPRNWLTPSLMEVLWRNRHNEYPQNIFEVADVVRLDDSETGASNRKRLAFLLCHSKANFSEIKSYVEGILRNLGIEKVKFEESESACFIPGRAAKIIANNRVVGRFGEIHPKVISNWQLEMPVCSCEMDIDLLFNMIK